MKDIQESPGSRPAIVWILICLLLVIGIGALISGAMLFIAPDGHLLGFPPDILEGSPFSSFLIPGIVLFIFLGMFPVFTAYSLLKKPGWRWTVAFNPYGNYHWAWSASWASGVIIWIWIAVETILLGYISFLQPVIAIWATVIIVLTILPPVRLYCSRR
jgi:hypothetical protein